MPGNDEDMEIWAERMLRRIGWHESERMQIKVYAQMSPARKVALMLQMRDEQVRLLRERLRREHPDCTEVEIAYMLQKHLDLVRERHE